MALAVNYGADNRRIGKGPVGPVALALLRKVWAIHLRRSEFHDLENPDYPNGPLAHVGNPGHLLTRGCEEGSGRIETTSAYYRRMEHVAVRLEDELDRQIGLALSDGIGVRRIKARLRVGQGRVERVAKQLRLWMAEPEDDNGEG